AATLFPVAVPSVPYAPHLAVSLASCLFVSRDHLINPRQQARRRSFASTRSLRTVGCLLLEEFPDCVAAELGALDDRVTDASEHSFKPESMSPRPICLDIASRLILLRPIGGRGCDTRHPAH